MQTFLPSTSFTRSAQCLDRQRLGKQRVEVLQILKALSGKSKGWIKHPAVLMWRGHEDWLISYGLAICHEWKQRGYKDSCMEKISIYAYLFMNNTSCPSWLLDNNNPLCSSHRAALLAKNYQWYSKFNWKEQPKIDYYWPTKRS